jgi:O-antigen/teichoic acid export membrane protein
MKLKRRIVSDAANVSTNNLVIAGTQFIETVVLARILRPEEMGLVAIIAVIIGLVRSFSDFGFGNALIHFQNTSRAIFSSLFWFLTAFGVLIFTAFLGCRPLCEWVLPGSPIIPLVGWIGLNFLFIPLGTLYQYHFQKEMRFRRIAIVESTARCAGTLTVILFALGKYGVFSFVAGQVVYNVVKSVFLLCAGIKLLPLSLTFDLSAITLYLRFGMFQMGERVVTFLSANIDYIIISKFLGARELGFYKIAYDLVTVPQRLVNPIFGSLALPRFAKNQHDDAALREGLFTTLRFLSVLTFPLLFGLAASADVFIPVVYGPGWDRAVPLLWLLTAMGLLKILGNIGGSVIVAKGHVKTGFIWNCIIAAGNSIAFLIAVRWGTQAIAAIYSVISLVYLLAGFNDYYKATIGLQLCTYVRSFALPAVLSAAMGATVLGLNYMLRPTHIHPIIELSLLAGFGLVIYVLLNVFLMRKGFTGLLSMIRGSDVANNVSAKR